MRDVLNRKVKEHDLVVVKGTGRHNLGLRVGIVVGDSIAFKNANKARYSEIFLIGNPSPEEENVRKEILEQIRLDKIHKEEQKKERKAKKAIPKKELKIGALYLSDNDERYVYLGKCEDGENEGYGYIYEDSWRTGKEEYKIDIGNYHIRKTTKKLVELIQENYIEVHNKMLIQKRKWNYSWCRYDILEKELILHDLNK